MSRELPFTKMHGAGNDFVVLDGIRTELPPLAPLNFTVELASFGVIADQAVRVRILFEPRWATYVEERNWHESQTFTKGPDGKIEISMDVGSTPDLRSWILSFGSGAEVLEPEELRAEVARELEEARVRYESASQSSITRARDRASRPNRR